MAAKIPPPFDNVPEDSDNPMPEEFRDDPSNSVPHTPSAGLSDDEFGAKGFNNAQDELERAKLNPPTGDWKKEDSWTFERQVFADDSQPDDFDDKGRTFLVFKGKPVAREANGLSYEPILRLRLSPDKRYKQDKPTEVDTAYKLFLKAKDMYMEKNMKLPETMNQYRSMLEHGSYYVRTMNGDNGAIITDIKLKTYQGGNNR